MFVNFRIIKTPNLAMAGFGVLFYGSFTLLLPFRDTVIELFL